MHGLVIGTTVDRWRSDSLMKNGKNVEDRKEILKKTSVLLKDER